MKDFKEKIYSSYYTSHTKQLYGETSIEKIKRQFPVYEYYFGKQLPINKNISVIDLGCGSGEFVYWLQNKGYKNTSGIDVSKELIEIGKGLGIQNILCDDIFNYLEKNDSKFDLMILRDVLEHFDKEETYKLITLLSTSLNENGLIILQVPNGQSPFMGKIFYGDFTHHSAFTESSLSQLFNSVGFNEIKVFETTPVPKNIKGVFRLLIWKCIRMYLKFLQLIATGDSSGYYSPNIIAVIKN